MLCSKPVTAITSTGPQLVGCGQCFTCDINKRRAWTARLLLEGLAAEAHGREVSWTTLTYDESQLPWAARGADGAAVETLAPHDYQLAFKRMRKRNSLGSFRFAICGEYGLRKGRPHYHALIFGPRTSDVEAALQEHWEGKHGHTRTRPWRYGSADDNAATSRAAYLANYVTKKMHQVGSPDLHPSQCPEFFRCSKVPALGYSTRLRDLVMSKGGEFDLAETGDVPITVRIAGKQWPLARVLRERLREELGVPQLKAEREALIKPTRPRPQPTVEDYHRAAQRAEKLKRAKTHSPF